MDAPLFDHDLDVVPPAVGVSRRPTLPPRALKGKGAGVSKVKNTHAPGQDRFGRWLDGLDLPDVIGVGLMLGYFLVALAMAAIEPSLVRIVLIFGLLLSVPLVWWSKARWSSIRRKTAVAVRKAATVTGQTAVAFKNSPRGRVIAGRVAVAGLLIAAGMVKSRVPDAPREARKRLPSSTALAPRVVARSVYLDARRFNVKAWHRDRLAIVYVRQSAPQDMLLDRDPRPDDREMVNQVMALGWPKDRIVILDEHGFDRLLTEVSQDHVGIVLGRDLRQLVTSPEKWTLKEDWDYFLDLCFIFGPLLADQDYVYDTNDSNSKLRLGFFGMRRQELKGVSEHRDWARLEEKSRCKLALLEEIVAGLTRVNGTDDRAKKALKTAVATRDSVAAKVTLYAEWTRWDEAAARRRSAVPRPARVLPARSGGTARQSSSRFKPES
jgi:hypothetical protein